MTITSVMFLGMQSDMGISISFRLGRFRALGTFFTLKHHANSSFRGEVLGRRIEGKWQNFGGNDTAPETGEEGLSYLG